MLRFNHGGMSLTVSRWFGPRAEFGVSKISKSAAGAKILAPTVAASARARFSANAHHFHTTTMVTDGSRALTFGRRNPALTNRSASAGAAGSTAIRHQSIQANAR